MGKKKAVPASKSLLPDDGPETPATPSAPDAPVAPAPVIAPESPAPAAPTPAPVAATPPVKPAPADPTLPVLTANASGMVAVTGSGTITTYTVVARRYRPQLFEELIGQEHIAQSLMNALTSGRIAHAYLFTGARGTGKTSTARILAKAMNCVKGPTPHPCGQCDSCVSIATGDDVDVLEIDGASNNGVDAMRELRSNVGFRPTRSRYKIYIIDEVHMLSTGAFNALLKTLEEPPPHIKFLFATTEIQKIPITILSRCQRFDFVNVGVPKIYEQLKHIVKKEGLQAEDEALYMIAKRAGGSMRDSQSLLDQLLAFAQGELTSAKVHEVLGTAGDDRIGALTSAILDGNAAAALEQVGQIAERGQQLGEVLDQLIEYWRALMILITAGPAWKSVIVSPTLEQQIRAHAQSKSLDTILAGLDVLTSAKQKMRGGSHVQTILEITLVRLARLEDLLPVGELAQWVKAGGVPSANVAPAEKSAAAKKKPLTAAPAVEKKTGESNATPAAPTGSDLWSQLIVSVGPMMGAHLRDALSHAISAPNNLVIHFPAGYSRAYDACVAETGRDSLLHTLKRLTGQDWILKVDRAAATAATGVEEPVVPIRTKKDLLQAPMFQKVVEMLGAQSINIDPDFDPRPMAVVADPAAETPEAEEGSES